MMAAQMAGRAALPTFAEQAIRLLDATFRQAYLANPFSFACSLLRVEPSGDEAWDPLRESHDALGQYADQLQARPGASALRAIGDRRLALLIYCHVTEISALYQVLANVLRCARGYPYLLDPFADLARSDARRDARRLPTPAQKIARVTELDPAPGRLSAMLRALFDADLRDAFYRSEYVLSEDAVRFRDSAGRIAETAWDSVEQKVRSATAFINAFFAAYDSWLRKLGAAPAVAALPGGGELTLLRDDDGLLTGFHWRRPGAASALFERRPGLLRAEGLPFDARGSLVRPPHLPPA